MLRSFHEQQHTKKKNKIKISKLTTNNKKRSCSCFKCFVCDTAAVHPVSSSVDLFKHEDGIKRDMPTHQKHPKYILRSDTNFQTAIKKGKSQKTEFDMF